MRTKATLAVLLAAVFVACSSTTPSADSGTDSSAPIDASGDSQADAVPGDSSLPDASADGADAPADGADGADGCPADPGAALGAPCSSEGMFCRFGDCSNPCMFCNVLRCQGGKWSRIEVPPLPCDAGGG